MTKFQLELLTDIHMLLIAEKRITGQIFQSVLRYAKPNNKYTKNYNQSKDSSYLKYFDKNNSYEWVISIKSSIDVLEWVKSHNFTNFVKKCNDNSKCWIYS